MILILVIFVFDFPQITHVRKDLTKGGERSESTCDNSYPPLTLCRVPFSAANTLKAISATVCIEAVWTEETKMDFACQELGKQCRFHLYWCWHGSWRVSWTASSLLTAASGSAPLTESLSVRFLSSINKETTLIRLLSDSTIRWRAHMQSILFSWFTDSRMNDCSYFGPNKKTKNQV